jgi:hypothetical protein
MTAVSGQYGKIMIGASTVAECTKWTWDEETAESKYASCSTAGQRSRVAGTLDSTGTLEGVLDPADDIHDYFDAGDHVTLKLYYTATKYHKVPAQINKTSMEVDIEEGSVIRWKADFGQTGAPTKMQT